MVSYADLLARARRDLETARIVFVAGDPNGAANRAYYAMYHAACASLMSAGFPRLALAKTHRGAISAFAEHIVQPGHVPAMASKMIAEAAKDRIVADYIGDGVSNETAEKLVANAAMFVDHVTAFIDRSARD